MFSELDLTHSVKASLFSTARAIKGEGQGAHGSNQPGHTALRDSGRSETLGGLKT
jgi:hypothetical protein